MERKFWILTLFYTLIPQIGLLEANIVSRSVLPNCEDSSIAPNTPTLTALLLPNPTPPRFAGLA